MKKIKKIFKSKFWLLSVILFLNISCSKSFLELEPQQSVSADNALVSIGDFNAAITGVYDGLGSSNYYGRYFVLVSDIMSDDIKQNASANRAADWAAYAGSATDNNNLSDNVWAQMYRVINRCNQIINSEADLSASQSELDNIKGEAYAVRALVYFDLVRLYGQHYTFTSDASHLGVPIVLDLDAFNKPARNSVKEVYDQVIQDLTTSLGLLNDDTNSFYMTKNGANALLSRVYLYKEDWTNAVTTANAVINSTDYTLVDNANYTDIFTTDHSSEAIFELDNNPTDTNGTNALSGMYLVSGYGDYLPSKDLINLIDSSDARQSMFVVDDGLSGEYASQRINKYSNILGEDNVPVIRLSEVYLNRAEAYAHISGNESNAQNDLNTIRQRGLLTAPAATSTGLALIDDILLERRIELCFEGNRLYDLTRNKKGVFRTDCTSDACSEPYPNERFILAIGQYELDSNPNMVQNPGY